MALTGWIQPKGIFSQSPSAWSLSRPLLLFLFVCEGPPLCLIYQSSDPLLLGWPHSSKQRYPPFGVKSLRMHPTRWLVWNLIKRKPSLLIISKRSWNGLPNTSLYGVGKSMTTKETFRVINLGYSLRASRRSSFLIIGCFLQQNMTPCECGM